MREAHREAGTVALAELERYTRARIGGTMPLRRPGSSSPRSSSTIPPAGRRVRRAAAPHPCGCLQYDRAGQRTDPGSPGARHVRYVGIRHRRLSVRAHPPASHSRLPAREWPARAPEIKGYTREYLEGIKPALPADPRAPPPDRLPGTGGRADRRARNPRRQGDPLHSRGHGRALQGRRRTRRPGGSRHR